jgi:hypothetical protein
MSTPGLRLSRSNDFRENSARFDTNSPGAQRGKEIADQQNRQQQSALDDGRETDLRLYAGRVHYDGSLR